jgi:hypothetical protein
MKADIIKFFPVNRKPNAGELYVNENNILFRCGDPERNDKESWPGTTIITIIPVLEKTDLSLIELKQLSDFVWENKLKDGTLINLTYSFSLSF